MINLPINLRQVHHLVVLTRFKSYVVAAKELGLTQSALTRSIQSLEKEHAVRLLDRDRGGVRLTPAGREVIAAAETLIYLARDLAQKLSESKGGITGHVAFGFVPHAAMILLSIFTPELVRDYPQLKMRVEVQNSGILLDLLAKGEIEIVVCSNQQVPPGEPVNSIPFMEVPLAALVRRDHPLASRSGLTMKDIHFYPTVGGHWSGYLTGLERDQPAPLNISCDDFRTLYSITLGTDAVWLAPSIVGLGQLERNNVVILTAERRTISSRARLIVDSILRAGSNIDLGNTYFRI
jgi:DNA-binding transcriptional LysR family regulator